MYGSGPPIGGGIIGGGLVTAGANPAWSIAFIVFSVLLGAGLFLRDSYIKRQRLLVGTLPSPAPYRRGHKAA